MNTLRVGSVAGKLDVSADTVWRFVRDIPDFPRPFKISPGVTVWFEHELDDYLLAKQGAECETG